MFDIDKNYTASHDDINNQDGQIVEVVPGVKAVIKIRVKRYVNSVSALSIA
jgi:ERCC4-type nuclease